jgi:hypothetical protein
MIPRDSARCVTLALVLLAGCAAAAPVSEVQGDCGMAYKGKVCTWALTQGDKVLEAGATIPMASIEGRPLTPSMDWPPVAEAKLKLPAAAQARAGLTQLTIFWEPEGHAPAPFMTPHFDFHFYVVPAGQEMAFDCKDRTKPAALPAGYVLPDEALPPEMVKMIGVDTLIGICVPNMGMHSLPGADLELKELFKGDIVVGYYAGKPIFIEPMISQALLMEKKPFDLTIPAIPGLAGMYPRKFHAEFDAKAQSYRFIFSGFAPGA